MTARSAPLVSVLVPTFNEDLETIETSFGSLRSQSWADFDCQVIDESTDPGRAAAIREACSQDQRFHYLRPESRIGLAASLNLGFANASGEFIARFDADDRCHPDRLALQVSFLTDHPDVGILGGAMAIMDDAGRITARRSYPLAHTGIARAMMLKNAMGHPTVMFRRTVAEAHGAYDPTFRFSEDLELWLRWLAAGVIFRNLPDTLVSYRQQTTNRRIENWESNLRARRKHFSTEHLPLRLLGLGSILLWSKLPAWLQERVYKRLIFDANRSESKE